MRTHRATSLTAISIAGLLTSTGAGAQSVTLEQADAAFPEDFGAVLAVRELPDGRVLLADPLGKALLVVDLDAGIRTNIGAEGEGPGEYRQPDAVWALPGDSTLLVDLGNGRLTAMGPDLSFGSTLPIALTEPRMGQPLVFALPQGVDREGNVYTRLMGGMGGELPDSATIVRIDRATRQHEEVARFKLGERTRSVSGGAGNQSVSIGNVPLSGEEAWGVAPDGSVVIARSGDYHVEWHHPDGTVTRGAPVPYDPVPIRTAEKEEWVAAQGRSGGGVSIMVGVSNGEASMSFGRGGAVGGPREIDTYTWPDDKPPFYQGRLNVDRRGRAWVRVHKRAGRAPTYDVFDRTARRVGSVTLPVGRSVVGFGKGAIYAVAFDEFDLSYLERYVMPEL